MNTSLSMGKNKQQLAIKIKNITQQLAITNKNITNSQQTWNKERFGARELHLEAALTDAGDEVGAWQDGSGAGVPLLLVVFVGVGLIQPHKVQRRSVTDVDTGAERHAGKGWGRGGGQEGPQRLLNGVQNYDLKNAG